ncbi:helix-turn-helix domain-containing protein [Bacillaceae bacterium Marseille-Q3522]|nr:helix-turn-helix domain-containing protein [Bacillaceae bacterium Marseille-Q3522]
MLENIQRLCVKSGISVAKLERELGFGRGSIYKWDKNSPSIDKLQKVANFFKVALDEVVGRGDIYDLGWVIKEERQSQGMAIEELSQETKLSPETIRMIEEDANPMTDYDLRAFAEAFGYTLPELLVKYDLYDEEIPPHFNGDVNAYLKFEEAKYQDAMQDGPETIAAHHDGEEWTDEELQEIERFKEFIKSKRKQQGD